MYTSDVNLILKTLCFDVPPEVPLISKITYNISLRCYK